MEKVLLGFAAALAIGLPAIATGWPSRMSSSTVVLAFEICFFAPSVQMPICGKLSSPTEELGLRRKFEYSVLCCLCVAQILGSCMLGNKDEWP